MKRLVAVLAVTLLAVFGAVSPAYATVYPSIYGCPNDSTHKGAVCLYQWETYNSSGGVWKRAVDDLGGSGDGGVSGCTNLNDQYWNGTSNPVYDTASSIIFNTWVPASTYKFEFFEWVNCNGSGRSFRCDIPNGLYVFGLQSLTAIPPVSSATCITGYGNRNFQNTIASIRVTG